MILDNGRMISDANPMAVRIAGTALALNQSIPVQLVNPVGNAPTVATTVPASDGVSANRYVLESGSFNSLFNNTSWDRARNNVQVNALGSGARTANAVTLNQVNFNGRGAIIYLDITAASGTGGLSFVVQSSDPTTGKYVNLHAPTAALTAIGTYAIVLYPGASNAGVAGSGNVQQHISAVLPRVFRVSIAHGDATSYTYSVGVSLIV